MPTLHSLHAKILFGYSVVGLLFVTLVVSALLNFRALETKIAEQQQVADFHDELRYARRMEKNYLLYGKTADLAEGIERANNALDATSNRRGIPVKNFSIASSFLIPITECSGPVIPMSVM